MGDMCAFDNIPKLVGITNWNVWYSRCENAAIIVGLEDFFLGKKAELVEPTEEEYPDIDDWNEQMLRCARFERQKQVLLGKLRERCVGHLAQSVEDLDSVPETLKKLDKACSVAGLWRVRDLYAKAHNCMLQEFQSFEDFINEFNTRVRDVNNMRSMVTIDDNAKCIILANSLGPAFVEWMSPLDVHFSVAGTGFGRAVSFDEFVNMARNRWASIEGSIIQGYEAECIKSYAAYKPLVKQWETTRKRKASAAFGGKHQYQGRELLGPPNEICALDYHDAHTNLECRMQKRPGFVSQY